MTHQNDCMQYQYMKYQAFFHFLGFKEDKDVKLLGNWLNLNYLPTSLASELSGSSPHSFNKPSLNSGFEGRKWFIAFNEITDIIIHVCMFL